MKCGGRTAPAVFDEDFNIFNGYHVMILKELGHTEAPSRMYPAISKTYTFQKGGPTMNGRPSFCGNPAFSDKYTFSRIRVFPGKLHYFPGNNVSRETFHGCIAHGIITTRVVNVSWETLPSHSWTASDVSLYPFCVTSGEGGASSYSSPTGDAKQPDGVPETGSGDVRTAPLSPAAAGRETFSELSDAVDKMDGLCTFYLSACLYMDRMREIYSPYTWNTLMRRYRRISRDMKRLFGEGKLSSTAPELMTVEDIRSYLVYRRGLGYSSKEYDHESSALRNLFKTFRKDTFERCLIEYPLLKRYGRRERLPSLSDGVYDRILETGLKVQGYRRLRSYALVLLCIKGSCRVKEIRLAKLSDLDTERWILHIAHPKGEHIYGEPRDVAIHPEIRPVIERYLEVRLTPFGSGSSAALFPSGTSEDGYLSANTLRDIKKIVEDDIGVKFDFRTCRRTFGQQLIDSNVDVETVSVLMGHKTTRTTEISYARRRNTQANERLMKSW
jgi:integrase